MISRELGMYVCVISSKRPHEVANLSRLIGPATWYVGYGEADAYVANGAPRVMESGGLCASRNLSMQDAFSRDVPCVQMDDDLRRIEMIGSSGKARRISWFEAVQYLMKELRKTPYNLAGVAPTTNNFFFHPQKPVGYQHFCVGDFLLILPNSLCFDENLLLKEDYDFTLQHIATYGGVARCNAVLATFLHRTNQGGAVAIRTTAREQEAIAYLRKKWGGAIRLHPRRKDEILLSPRHLGIAKYVEKVGHITRG